MTTRHQLSQHFLDHAGWGRAARRFLAGDASDRSYDRLEMAGRTAVLMDAPPGRGDDPADFLRIARHLLSLGLSAPQVLAEDLEHGFLLLEDLGDALFARVLETQPALEAPLYAAATDVLLAVQAAPAPAGVPDLTASDWAAAATLALTEYAAAVTGTTPAVDAFEDCLMQAIRTHADGPRVLILRDFHAENLIWLPDRPGLSCVGLLDFQLAQMGQPGYDLVSLLQDARRDVAPQIEAVMVARFVAASGAYGFAAAYAVLGAQRALRILGIFARLCRVAGKPGYLRLLPRVWGHLQRNLAHPALSELDRLCRDLVPEPTPSALARIAATCPTPTFR